jgi:hypothetical protein
VTALVERPQLALQPGNHVCAFYNGARHHLDDIVVEWIITNGLIIDKPYYLPKHQFRSEL